MRDLVDRLVDVDSQVVAELREQATKTLTAHLGAGPRCWPTRCPTSADDVAHGAWTVIDGTAHYPNMERPDEFNRLVLDFIA